MNWKENLEELRESLLHGGKPEEKQESREARSGKNPHWVDKAAGSEVLDD